MRAALGPFSFGSYGQRTHEVISENRADWQVRLLCFCRNIPRPTTNAGCQGAYLVRGPRPFVMSIVFRAAVAVSYLTIIIIITIITMIMAERVHKRRLEKSVTLLAADKCFNPLSSNNGGHEFPYQHTDCDRLFSIWTPRVSIF